MYPLIVGTAGDFAGNRVELPDGQGHVFEQYVDGNPQHKAYRKVDDDKNVDNVSLEFPYVGNITGVDERQMRIIRHQRGDAEIAVVIFGQLRNFLLVDILQAEKFRLDGRGIGIDQPIAIIQR